MSCADTKASFSPADSKLVDLDEAEKFICRCMEATGAPPAHASSLADVLLAGDRRGHYSHGMNRLGEPSTHPETHMRRGKLNSQFIVTARMDFQNFSKIFQISNTTQ